MICPLCHLAYPDRWWALHNASRQLTIPAPSSLYNTSIKSQLGLSPLPFFPLPLPSFAPFLSSLPCFPSALPLFPSSLPFPSSLLPLLPSFPEIKNGGFQVLAPLARIQPLPFPNTKMRENVVSLGGVPRNPLIFNEPKTSI